jgi:cyclophilin family peptidyl-prolyl cis-trans isomerase
MVKKILVLSALVILSSLLVGTGCGDGENDGDENGDATNRIAVIETSMGTIKFELYEQRAPTTTANFISLAESGFYDGLIFHRVIDDFMIQTGQGEPVDMIELEIHEELRHTDGAVSMASIGYPYGGSSQFFICDGAQHGLDGNYAVFGQVIEGMDVVRAIAAVECDDTDPQFPVPLEDVVMTKVTIQSA